MKMTKTNDRFRH